MRVISEETRRRMSEARKNSAKVRALWEKQKGVPLTPERRKKISDALIGVPLSAGRRKNMSVAHKESPKARAQFANVKAAQTGRPLTAAHRFKLSMVSKADPRKLAAIRKAVKIAAVHNRGRKPSPETLQKLSAAHKTSPKSIAHQQRLRHVHLGRKRPEWWRERMREARARIVIPKRDTSIERMTQDYLRQRGVEFATHRLLPGSRHQYDIAIPSRKVVIECDGCYWHACPVHSTSGREDHAARDIIHDEHARSSGWTIIRLWEHEIRIGDFSKLDALNIE